MIFGDAGFAHAPKNHYGSTNADASGWENHALSFSSQYIDFCEHRLCPRPQKSKENRGKYMTTFNELLTRSADVKGQIWLIGTKDEVERLINECYVKRLARDQVQFSAIIPMPNNPGKFLSVLIR
jgi:hypothetical protein